MRRTWFDWTLWGFTALGVLFAIAAIIVPVLLERRELTIEIVSRTRFLESFSRSAKERMSILMDGRPIEDFTIVQIRITNTGRKAIAESDFEAHPLVFQLSDINRIQFSTLLSSDPNGLVIKVAKDKDRLRIAPFGLNPKASFVIESGIHHATTQTPRLELLGQVIATPLRFLEGPEPPQKASSFVGVRIIPVIAALLMVLMGIVVERFLKNRVQVGVQVESKYLPVIRLFRWIKNNESKFPFLSVKFLREKVFHNDSEMRSALQFAIDEGMLQKYKVPNPNNVAFPTTAVRIDLEHPLYKSAILTQLG